MLKHKDRTEARQRRHVRTRSRVAGTPERPRLCVFRSLAHIHAQLIDDQAGRTLAAASTLDPEIRERAAAVKKAEGGKMVGLLLARRAQERGVRRVVFDRAGYLYHGRVKALADGAREGGLEF